MNDQCQLREKKMRFLAMVLTSLFFFLFKYFEWSICIYILLLACFVLFLLHEHSSLPFYCVSLLFSYFIFYF